MDIFSWRIRSAGPEGFWLFWDPRFETVSLSPGRQPDESARGMEVAGEGREGREAEAGRAVSPNQCLAECETPLQFILSLGGDGATCEEDSTAGARAGRVNE